MIYNKEATEEKMKEVLHYVLTSGFNIRQALIQTNFKGFSNDQVPRIPPIMGVALIVALEKQNFDVYRYLWSEEFINVWGPKHYQMILDILHRNDLYNLVAHHLNSPVGTNQFLILPQTEKMALVHKLYDQFQRSTDIQLSLSEPYYAPYFLMILIERDTFMKLGDFNIYNKCLNNCNQYELESLSRIQEYEDRFVRFMKYIDILEANDPKKTEGQKLIQKIFSFDKFKAYQNVSLQVFDQESRILEEEDQGHESALEEGARRVI